MIALMLLPNNWPYNRRGSDFSRCMMTKEAAHRVMAVLKREAEKEDKAEEEMFEGYKSKREYTEEGLYSLTGDVSDIQNMSSFPERIQDIIHQFEDTFSCKLNEGR